MTERPQFLQRLAELGKVLTSSEVLPDTLVSIGEMAIEVLGADLVDIYQYQADYELFIVPPIMLGNRRFPELKPQQIHPDDVVAKIVASATPIYATEAQNDPILTAQWEIPREQRPPERFVVRERVVSSVGLPLIVSNETVGVLFLSYRSRQNFAPEFRASCEIFASHAAVAIQNARLVQDEQQRRRFSETLQKVAQIVNSAQELNVVVDLVLGQLAEVVEYNSASVQLIQGDQRTLVGGRGFLVGEPPHELLRNVSKDPLINKIVRQKRAVILSNVAEEPLWDRMLPTARIKSWMGIPLIFKDEVIGLLTIDHIKVGSYTQESGEIATAFANQVAVAVYNSIQMQNLTVWNASLQVLQEVGPKISATLNLEEILPVIVKGAMQLTETGSGVIHLIDATGENISHSYGYPEGFTHTQSRFSKKQGLTWTVFQTGETVEIPVVDQSKDVSPGLKPYGIKSLIGVPLKKDEQVIGVLFLNSLRPRRFTPDEKVWLTMLAQQAVIAVQNAELFQESEERAKRLERLQRVATVLSGESRDSRKTLRSIVDSLSSIFGGTPCSVLYDFEDIKFRVRVGTQEYPIHKIPPARPDGTTAYVVKNKTPLYIADVQKPPPGVPTVKQERIDRGTRAIAYLPLLIGDEVIGILHVNFAEPYLCSSDDKKILDLFAQQAAIALENARLFEQLQQQRREQIETIRKIAVSVSTTSDPEMILADLLDDALYLLKANLGEIRLYDPTTEQLIVRVAKGQTLAAEFSKNKIGEGITGWVAKHKKSRIVNDVTHLKPPEYLPFLSVTKSEVAVPMLSQDEQLVGVLNIESPEYNAFTEEDQVLLEALASQGAIAVQDAQFVERLTSLQSIATAIASESLDLKKMLSLIVESVNQIFRGVGCSIRLYNSQMGDFEDRIATGERQAQINYPPRPEGIGHYLIKRQQPLYYEDNRKPPSVGIPAVRSQIVEQGMLATAALPLLSRGKPVGAMYVYRTTPWQFSANDKQILELFAQQAAISIENARLYEQLAQANENLEQMNEGLVKQLQQRVAELEKIGQLGSDLADAGIFLID